MSEQEQTKTSFPFLSQSAHSRASDLLRDGAMAVAHPNNIEYAKPKGHQIEELLWEIGRSQMMRAQALKAAEDAIPETLAPRNEGTMGGLPLVDRVREILRQLEVSNARNERAEAALVPALQDTTRLNALLNESWDLRCFPVPTAGGDDADIGWRVIGHWMADPQERVVGEVFHDNPRAAIDDALSPIKREG